MKPLAVLVLLLALLALPLFHPEQRTKTLFLRVERAPFPVATIAFVREGNLWLRYSDGQEQQVVSGGVSRPVWSPDGTRIAYVRSMDGRSRTGEQVEIVDVPEGHVVVAVAAQVNPFAVAGTRAYSKVLRVRWSEDGRYLFYWRDLGNVSGKRIFRYDLAEGGESIEISYGLDFDVARDDSVVYWYGSNSAYGAPVGSYLAAKDGADNRALLYLPGVSFHAPAMNPQKSIAALAIDASLVLVSNGGRDILEVKWRNPVFTIPLAIETIAWDPAGDSLLFSDVQDEIWYFDLNASRLYLIGGGRDPAWKRN